MEHGKARSTLTGKIVNIDYDKRAMLVRSNDDQPTEYPLKWEAVMDDVCNKEKVGHRVSIVVETDCTKEDPQPYIVSLKFDESYRKKPNTYADPNSDIILLQSCFRTGAEVLATVWPAEDITDMPSSDSMVIEFNNRMDMLIERAVRDARRLKAEARKL